MANIGINISENGTTTLATAGKYCDRNIDVVVDVAGSGGADIPEEAFYFTGNITGLFTNNNWKYFLNNYSDDFVFENILNAQNMFLNSSEVEDLSKLEIPLNKANIQSMFSGCSKLKYLPKVTGKIQRYITTLFSNCHNLSSDEINKFFENISVESTDNNLSMGSVFQNCYSIRNLTDALDWLHTNINTYSGSSSTSFFSLFYFCIALDEITNMPVITVGGNWNSNSFNNTFYFAFRLKDVIFKTNDGAPILVNWKNQIIDLTSSGYVNLSYKNYLFNYDTGITADKEVTDDTTYQALKNDADWFTTDIAYSRYNHDSAVNTINSLPDTSAYIATAGGTNTIKFKGAAGSSTDGGAINTLTDAEIAVAAAKGWTVSFA